MRRVKVTATQPITIGVDNNSRMSMNHPTRRGSTSSSIDINNIPIDMMEEKIAGSSNHKLSNADHHSNGHSNGMNIMDPPPSPRHPLNQHQSRYYHDEIDIRESDAQQNLIEANHNHNHPNDIDIDNNNEEAIDDQQHQNDFHASFHNLTVGSLPSIRRERRFMVSSGNTEFYTDQHNHHSRPRVKQRSSGSTGLGMSFREEEMSSMKSSLLQSQNRSKSSGSTGMGIRHRVIASSIGSNSNSNNSGGIGGIGAAMMNHLNAPSLNGHKNGIRRGDDDAIPAPTPAHGVGASVGVSRKYDYSQLARSMPVPSAPFLASRNDQASGERLSR